MKILGVFAGQGDLKPDLFHFFRQTPALNEEMMQAFHAFNLPLDLMANARADKSIAQLEIGLYHAMMFSLIEPHLTGHQVDLCGYSLGEVSAFLASVGAPWTQWGDALRARTDLMVAALSGHQYDLMSVRTRMPDETLAQWIDAYHCYVAIYNSETHWVVGGALANLRALATKLMAEKEVKVRYLDINLPSHTPFYERIKGAFGVALQALPYQTMSYPILSPLSISRVNRVQDEIENLDASLYCALDWRQLAQLLSDYQYDLIIDLGPGSAMTTLLSHANADLAQVKTITVSEYTSQEGLIAALMRSCRGP